MKTRKQHKLAFESLALLKKNEPFSFSTIIDDDHLELLLLTFLQYGFKKTSMDDLAKAVGISRQALYKKYGNKELIFEAMVHGNLSNTLLVIKDILDSDSDIEEKLYSCFELIAGRFIDQMRATPNKAEVAGMLNSEMGEVTKLYEPILISMIEEAVLNEFDKNLEQTSNFVFTLMCAARGLVHGAQDTDDFSTGIKRVLALLIENYRNI